MPCSWGCSILSLLHFVFILAGGHKELSDTLLSLLADQGPDLSVVHPVKTNADGEFISNEVSHHFNMGRQRRDLRGQPLQRQVYYHLSYKGRNLKFNLTANKHLISKDYVLEKRKENTTEHRFFQGNSCHLIGTVDASGVSGTAAISTCKGLPYKIPTYHYWWNKNGEQYQIPTAVQFWARCQLKRGKGRRTWIHLSASGANEIGRSNFTLYITGFFSLPEGHFFIEPVQKSRDDAAGLPEPHIIYPKASSGIHRLKRDSGPEQTRSPCGVQDAPSDSIQAEREREEWERKQLRAGSQPRSHRSVSRERWVETMVVADSKLIEYHGSENVESYIFTIMNMVAGIFHDASIGNAIHVILVRLILLQGQEKGLKIVHNADTTLASFCAWQKHLNPQNDAHPAHHDLAILITRKDICAGMNQPCETLGLSHLSGMCQPHRSCNINEDSGLPVAFTVAHEMGHSFGIQHDGQGNDCELQGKHPFIMSRQLMYDTSPLTWSSCSKDYVTRFLDRGWGFCLDDRPSKRDIATPLARLGIRYTTHHQCQLQYGPNATFCPEVDNVCQILWCSVNGSCRSKLDSPIDGTRCGPEKWCISGECVIVGKLPETVNGGWGPWSTWSYCSRTCGTGVQSADRECNNPKPEFGGRYCTGERKRYRTCNTKPCQRDKPTFREMLCSEFDTVPYHNELYSWIPVFSPMNPCELHCQPVGEFFSERMLDIVTDGTPCFMNNKSRNICVNGVCKDVGCDYGIESNAVEDQCGVCLGDGTSCQTVSKSFDQGEEFGYVDVGVIPKGARYISVKEVSEVGNFLALKSVESEEYFLNGNFIIQWNGEYEVGGTTFYYERNGNMENLTAPGPTKQPVMLQLLIQEKNPGIMYEYTIKKTKDSENEVTEPIYFWRHGAWTACSTTCGLGEQHQPVRCFQVDMGVVDESLCDTDSRPDDNLRQCKNMECPARWWVGSWQQCTATCGSDGVRKRTVLCVRTVSWEERVLHPVECKHLLKPKPVVPCNRDIPCGQEWAVSSWEECSVTCGGGVRSRNVTCALTPRKSCNLATKPRSRSLCALQNCPSSSFHRKPGFLSRSHRIFPPRNPPSKHPGTTAAPTSTKKEATPSFIPKTTLLPDIEPRTPEIINADDYDFSFGMRKIENLKNLTKSSFPENQKQIIEEENLEEGSTPTMLIYTAGYDYVVEDRTTAAEDKISDMEVFTTATSLRSFLQVTPSKQQKSPVTMQRIRASATTTNPAPFTNTQTWATRHLSNPHITSNISQGRRWTRRNPLTTPSYRNRAVSPKTDTQAKRAPSVTPTKTLTTAASLHPTPTTVKMRKSAPVLEDNNSSSRPSKTSSKSRSGGSKSQNQNQKTPQSNSASHQDKLNARETASMDVFWIVGNWSECSTTCGIGAVWRAVACSSQNDEDCAEMKRPEPARTCHLQPCATWQAGSWSKCPDDCALVRRRFRDVQCVDAQSKRPLRPFHCQAVSSRPVSTLVCPHKPCMNWSVSSWGPCTGSCGEGVRERLVFCAEPHHCSTTLRPNSTEPCSLEPCAHWKRGDWEECSVSCGGGQQRRSVMCVAEQESAVVPNSHCEKILKPETLRMCSMQECSPACRKNTISSRFCEKLKLLGRCTLRSVQRQCCVTCRP